MPSRMRTRSRSSESIRKRTSGSVSGFGDVMRKRPREYVWYAVIQMKPCDRLMPIRFIAIRNMSFSPAPPRPELYLTTQLVCRE